MLHAAHARMQTGCCRSSLATDGALLERTHQPCSRLMTAGRMSPREISSFSPGSRHLFGLGAHGGQRWPAKASRQAHRKIIAQGRGTDAEEGGPLPPAHVDYLSSASNPYVKHCVKLGKSRDYRRQMGTVLLSGEVLLAELVQSAAPPAVRMLMLDEAAYPQGEALEGPLRTLQAERVVRVSEAVLKRVAGVENADGLRAIAEIYLPPADLTPASVGDRVLVLDGLQDPGNVGTLLRTALALGWTSVLLLPECCDPFNEKALRAGRGAVFKLPVHSVTWDVVQDLATEGKMHLLAADVGADDNNLAPHLGGGGGAEGVGLVLGSEGQGLSAQAMQACKAVTLPMSGKMESMNVAVAGGILMYLLRDEK